MTSLSALGEGTRRAQPLLGTLVEVTVWHSTDSEAQRACDAAFAAVAAIDAAMSYHRGDSDLSRLNHAAPGVAVEVGLDMWAVLASAVRLHHVSKGLFDCTIAERLESEGFLPRAGGGPSTGACAAAHRATDRPSQTDVLLPAPGQVLKRRPLRLDLGGIAKGYAVDRAVGALRSAGAVGGCVNAGGDVRVFGPCAMRIDVRDPGQPGRAGACVELKDAALATSSGYFNGDWAQNARYAPIVDPRTNACIEMPYSVTVAARRCVFADGLTKVVALSADRHHPALDAFHAEAWILGNMEAGHA